MAQVGIVAVGERKTVLLVLIEFVLKFHGQLVGRILRAFRLDLEVRAAIAVSGDGGLVELIGRPAAVEHLR